MCRCVEANDGSQIGETVFEGCSEVADWKHGFASKICFVRGTRTSQEASAIKLHDSTRSKLGH
jgi:hypothetical protein